MKTKKKIRKGILFVTLFTMIAFSFLTVGLFTRKESVHAATELASSPLEMNGILKTDAINAPQTSSLDSIAIRREQKVTIVDTGWIDVKVSLTYNDFSTFDETWIRFSYPNKQNHTLNVAVYLVDDANVTFGWKTTTGTPTAGVIQSAVAVNDDPVQSTTTGEGKLAWNYTQVSSADERFYIYSKANGEQYKKILGYETADKTFNWANVKYALFRIPLDSNLNYDLRLGSIYGRPNGGTFQKAFDPAAVQTVGTSSANDVSYAAHKNTQPETDAANFAPVVNDFSVRKMRANEIFLASTLASGNYEIDLKNMPADLSAYNGIKYYVDTTGCGKITMNCMLADTTETDNEPYWSSALCQALLYPDEGEHYVSPMNELPANFKGYVVIAFTDFRTTSVAKKDGVFDLTKILTDRMAFTIASPQSENAFILKDVCFVGDAKTQIRIEQHLQLPDGTWGSNVMQSIEKEELLAGSTYVPHDFGDYVVDSGNPKNVFNPTSKNCVKAGLPAGGNVTGDFRATVYYKLKPQKIEKIFGMDEVNAMQFTADMSTESILENFPQEAISVGTVRKDLVQLSGAWQADERTDTSLQLTFVPTNLPETVVDTDSVLTVTVSFPSTNKTDTTDNNKNNNKDTTKDKNPSSTGTLAIVVLSVAGGAGVIALVIYFVVKRRNS